jgi:hypothetical protein
MKKITAAHLSVTQYCNYFDDIMKKQKQTFNWNSYVQYFLF